MSQDNVDARLIGVIGKPHGIKGEINVMLATDYPNTILKGSILFMDHDLTIPIEVDNIRQKKLKGRDVSVIKFAGIDDRNEAQRLKGKNRDANRTELSLFVMAWLFSEADPRFGTGQRAELSYSS